MSEQQEKMRRSPEARIAEYNKKIEQLRVRKQQLEAQLNERERKARTRRLIEIGAIFEKNFNLFSKEEAEHVAHTLRDQADSLLKELRESNFTK